MINSLEIIGLNGIEGNDIKLRFNEGLTIIVGKNGTGKTTILNILNSIISKSFNKLTNYEFKRILVNSDKGNLAILNYEGSIIVKRNDIEKAFLDSDLPISGETITKISKIFTEDDPLSWVIFNDHNVDKDFNNLIEKVYLVISKNDVSYKSKKTYEKFLFAQKSLYFPTYRRLEQDLGELLSDSEITDLPHREYNYSMRQYRMLIDDLTNRMSNISSSRNTVIGLSNKDIEELLLKEWNKVTDFEKNRLNKLIGDFFFSLFSNKQSNTKKTNSLDLHEGIDELAEFFSKAGIMENPKIWHKRLNEYHNDLKWFSNFDFKHLDFKKERDNINRMITIETRKVFIDYLVQMYHDSQTEILSIKEPFNKLVQNLDVFLKPKKVIIDDGSIRFAYGEESLRFENLSAGEKQLVALFVYTQLAVEDESVIIIDEPELSLHVSWQRQLLTALTSSTPSVQYIVSTHSPFIISSHKNNVILLDQNWEEYY